MVRDIRVTYRRRHSYNTKSNGTKLVKTPGGRLVVHYRKKHANGVKCGDCPVILHGVAHARPADFRKLPAFKRSVTRSYGGNLCADCVRTRVLRAFIVEEQKIVKAKIEASKKSDKTTSKKEAGAKGKGGGKGKGGKAKGKK
mmetsp:Transcript_134111/g.199497  ORF Transcript_134111/g.199497 Transcript_134111/m.199497 type:complete len:142 (-) Transcript_134111:2-427(-)